MRIAYVNVFFRSNHTGGGSVHMGQFVANAIALGHEVWSYPNSSFPEAHIIPTTRVEHIKTLRRMDVLYIRVESDFPDECTWSLPPRRLLYGFPVVVWEFNTTPEHALLRGKSEQAVNRAISLFRHYSRGCDLAICVTSSLAKYVQDKLGIQRVLMVPNSSDPELFRPDAPVVKRLAPFKNKFNAVWIGSAKEPWHDFKMLGEAAQIISESEQRKEIAFHIIGPDLIGIMADMPPNVFYWGAEYYQRLPNWLAGMDVGLSLYRPGSADYGNPLKVFDYMASGLTVVSTPGHFMRELFNQLDQTELLVDAGDSKKLAEILIMLASKRERLLHQGQAGRQLVIERYNWQRAVQQTMDELETIFRERKINKRL